MRIRKTITATLTAVGIMLTCVSVAPQPAAAQYGAYPDEPKSAAGYYAGRVYITEGSLPNTIQFADLGKITVKKMVGYTGAEELWDELAQKARERGANVVVNVEAFRSPTLFSWAAPHLEGRAIRVSNTAKLAASGVHFRKF